ncbi:MAG TPA: hypothetical protein VHH73_09150, partial [Verrucomicrobiae bacterium]|nr:hypothetical protein [Verrucomicrobiae bacterium]
MPKLRFLLALLFPLLAAGPAVAQAPQPVLAPFQLQVVPATNVVFIAEAPVQIQVIVHNGTNYTNLTVTGLVATNLVATNMLGNITNNPNITTNGDLILRFASDGPKTTNDTTGDVTNRVTITPGGPTLTGYFLPLRLTIRGIDLNPNNPPSDLTDFTVITNLVVNYIVNPRPQNNIFTNAFKFDPSGGIMTGSNVFANLEASEPAHAQVAGGAASVWWTWSPPVTTNVLIDTAGSSFNPVLAVYTGSSVASLTPVASSTNDPINHLQANVVFNATRGTTYRIAVSSATTNANATGDIRLRIVPGGTPDNRPPAIVINSPNRETLVGSPILTVSGIAREASLLDSGISNIVLQVNNGGKTNAIGAESWTGSVTLPPGTNVVHAYAIDYAGNISAEDAIIVRFINPTNDFFASATQLTGVGGVVRATNTFASKEPNEPLHADNEGGRSIWYYFRAPSDGTLALTTEPSTLDTLLALYTGTNLTSLIPVAANDDLTPGSKYSALTQLV